MYIPKSFNETRLDVLHSLVRQHPLGTVITHDGAGLQANHIPFEIAPASDAAPFGILRAHVARANPLWQHKGDTLTVFQGPSAYVSPSLYEEKPVSGKVVPTWNYAVLHAHGRMRAVEDPAWILALLERLTTQHESARRAPWTVADAPAQFIDQLLGAIVGIEIVIERMDGKWKMSQNRSQHDQLAMAADTGLRLAS